MTQANEWLTAVRNAEEKLRRIGCTPSGDNWVLGGWTFQMELRYREGIPYVAFEGACPYPEIYAGADSLQALLSELCTRCNLVVNVLERLAYAREAQQLVEDRWAVISDALEELS